MKTAYLLGIGGAGMAGTAQFLQEKGWRVGGYDRSVSVTARSLQKRGIPIDTAPNPKRLEGVDLCVYSAAIPQAFPLLKAAKEQLPTLSRGEMMGQIAKEFSKVVAVAGTHGKTTTVGMIAHLLQTAGQDPSVLIGGPLASIGGYGHYGKTDLLVCEACEYAESFLHLSPTLGVLLNVDRDHLEYYGSMAGLTKGFSAFLQNCTGCLVNGGNQKALAAAQNHPNVTLFGGKTAPLTATELKEQKGRFSFTLCHKEHPLGTVRLQVSGKHQVENALAAAGVGLALGLPFQSIQKGLSSFTGVGRRFEIVYENPWVTVADDYAHHPTELAAVLSAAKGMGYSRITAIFQPFTYSRTAALYREFANALSLADRVILAPVMAGREPPIEGVSSQMIADLLPGATLCQTLSHCGAVALQNSIKGELILTLGCGNVNECALEMAEYLKNRASFC